MNSHQKEVLKVWIAAGLWLVVIAIESTKYMSTVYTGRFLYPICHFLFGIDHARFLIWHHYIRKTGHFVGYFILSVLMFRAWRETLPKTSGWTFRWAAIAFVVSAMVASLDEWHQTFIPTRTGLVSDVMLDSCAALFAQLVIFLWLRRRGTRQLQPAGLSMTR